MSVSNWEFNPIQLSCMYYWSRAKEFLLFMEAKSNHKRVAQKYLEVQNIPVPLNCCN